MRVPFREGAGWKFPKRPSGSLRDPTGARLARKGEAPMVGLRSGRDYPATPWHDGGDLAKLVDEPENGGTR